MTNEEAVINGVNFEETISEFELLFDEWHNKDFCTMTRIRDYAEYYKEENTKLKAEIEQLKAEFEQSNSRIKDKIISRRWKFASDTNPTEAMGMQWANRMNYWCIEIVEEAEQSLKGQV